MGTTFDDIYCQSRLLKLEKVLSSLPKPMYYSLNFRWLRYAISLFEFDIIPQSKLTEYTPFWEKDFNYVGDGTDTEFAVPYYDVPNSLQIALAIISGIILSYFLVVLERCKTKRLSLACNSTFPSCLVRVIL